MAISNNMRAVPAEMVFDRTLLHDYSMQNQDLAAEILELFLIQLPSMLDALDTASCETSWNFATHTLKGSSASMGARRLQQLAAELEATPFPGDSNVRLLRLQAVRVAAADFRQAARQAYPGPP